MTTKRGQNGDLIGESLRAAFDDTVSEGVPEEFRKLIDDNLKKAFDETVEEGVPDRFAALLAQLKDAAAGDDE